MELMNEGSHGNEGSARDRVHHRDGPYWRHAHRHWWFWIGLFLMLLGTLRRYIDDFSVTGLTSDPSIFDLAIKTSNFYDEAIQKKKKEGKSGEVLFFELAIEDLRQAADLFRPVYNATACAPDAETSH